jgi:hypothetical protein
VGIPCLVGALGWRMRYWVFCTLLCVLVVAVPASALAGWGAPEPVGTDINQILLPPGGPGFVVGFPATSPSRVRFAFRPFEGSLGSPNEFPSGIGQHTLPAIGFDSSGDAVILDEEVQEVAWRSADGETSTPQKLEGHLLARWPRLVSVAPDGTALIGVNELRPHGSPVQLAFRPAGIGASVDSTNTVDLTAEGTLIGLQLQADGGAIAVYIDDAAGRLMQVVRRAGETKFDTPTEIVAPPGTHNVSEITFSGDPSGWAMLGASGKSSEGGPVDEVLGAVRAPDGSFPTATVVATGTGLSNVTPAVTASGDGLLTWKEGGLGSPSCPAFAIRGAAQHLGAWSGAMAVGPDAWPDASIPAYAATSFSSGNDISVPMVHVHADGAPCPTTPQTRSLIVHHYRSGPTGLTDQGTTELTPLSATNQQQVEGWAMEPAGKIFAWYRVGEERFLRVFDGVTPGTGGSPPAGTTITPSAPGPGPATAKPSAVIPPLVLQQFAVIPTIDPKSLEFEMECPPIGNNEDICAGRAEMYYTFTGKHIKANGARVAAAKKQVVLIASGTLKLKSGQKGHLKLHPNKAGKALLKAGKKLKVTVKMTVAIGGRSVSGTIPTSIKARKKH